MQNQGDQVHPGPSGLPPMFTEADEQRESATMTPEETAAKTADMFGLAESLSNCRISEDELLPEALYLLDRELDDIPGERKTAFLEAQQKCPDLVSDSHKEAFLWSEDLDAKLAAERLINYWQLRLELFGPMKCFLHMTLEGAMRDDHEAVAALAMHILPTKDSAGRCIIYYKNPPDFSRFDHKSLARAGMYVLHTAIEDREVQKRGAIFLRHPRSKPDVWWLHSERQRYIRICYRLLSCFPIRTRAQHALQPDLPYRFIIGISKVVMGKSMRQRVENHTGSNEDVLNSLERFGISRDQLPSEIGGTVVLADRQAWINNRMALEQRDLCRASGNPPSISTATSRPRRGDPRMNRAVEAKDENPSLSLLGALIEGGFEFDTKLPREDGASKKRLDSYYLDKDGVSLQQRKNQLSRRLRNARKKKAKEL